MFLETLPSNFVYKFKCKSYAASYCKKTNRHMKVRVPEHQDVSPRTCKQVKSTLSTWLRDHMLNCNHCNSLDKKINGRLKQGHMGSSSSTTESISSPLPQCLWPPNLVEWWLTIRDSKPIKSLDPLTMQSFQITWQTKNFILECLWPPNLSG